MRDGQVGKHSVKPMHKWLGHHDVGNIYAIDDSFLEAGGGIPQSSLRSEGGRHVTGDSMNVRNLCRTCP